jgi:hypothetical protein
MGDRSADEARARSEGSHRAATDGIREQADPSRSSDQSLDVTSRAAPAPCLGARFFGPVGRQGGDHKYVQGDDQDRPDGP